jgi:hypothetical protein
MSRPNAVPGGVGSYARRATLASPDQEPTTPAQPFGGGPARPFRRHTPSVLTTAIGGDRARYERGGQR